MLRFDGYYIEEPSEVSNARSANSSLSFIFLAYTFFENSKLYWTIQHEREDGLFDFSKENFQLPKAFEEKWHENGEEIVIEKSEEYTGKVVLKKVGELSLFNLHSKKHLHFVPWTRLESEQEPGAILKSIFGPFEEGKYTSVKQEEM